MGFGSSLKKITKKIVHATNPVTALKPSRVIDPIGSHLKDLGLDTKEPIKKIIGDKLTERYGKVLFPDETADKIHKRIGDKTGVTALEEGINATHDWLTDKTLGILDKAEQSRMLKLGLSSSLTAEERAELEQLRAKAEQGIREKGLEVISSGNKPNTSENSSNSSVDNSNTSTDVSYWLKPPASLQNSNSRVTAKSTDYEIQDLSSTHATVHLATGEVIRVPTGALSMFHDRRFWHFYVTKSGELVYYELPIKALNQLRNNLIGSDAASLTNMLGAGLVSPHTTRDLRYKDHYKDASEDLDLSNEKINEPICGPSVCQDGNSIRIDPSYTLTKPDIDELILTSPKYDKPIPSHIIPDSDPNYSEEKYQIPKIGLWARPEYACPTIPDFSSVDFNNTCLEDKLAHLFNDYDTGFYDVAPIDLAVVTEKTVTGHGAFDWFSEALSNQLQKALRDNLITKSDVAHIYTQTLMGSLSSGIEFALQNNNMKWQNQLVQAQVITAKLQAISLKGELLMLPKKLEAIQADLELKKEQLRLARYQTEITKQQIPLTCAQIKQAELNIDATRVQMRAQEAQIEVTQNTAAQVNVQTEVIKQQLHRANTEMRLLDSQIKQSEIQIQTVQNQAVQSEIQNELLRVQVDNASMDIKTKENQIAQIQAGIENQYAQTKLAVVQSNLAKAKIKFEKAQASMVNEQVRAAQAQYKDDVDGNPIGGVLGAQIAVHRMQAECFDRDSYSNFISNLSSGWQTKKTSDIATISPDHYTAYGLGKAIDHYAKHYFNMDAGIFKPNPNYRDYLTDEEMEGTKPTPTGSAVATGK